MQKYKDTPLNSNNCLATTVLSSFYLLPPVGYSMASLRGKALLNINFL